MKAKLLTVMPLATALATCLSFSSCGGGSQRNDQGASFLALGYFDTSEGEPEPIGFQIAFLSSDAPYIVPDSNVGLDGAFYTLAIGMQNRLNSQFIRAERIECDYRIPGSNLDIPTDSMTIGVVLSGADEEDPTGQVGEGEDPSGAEIVYYPFEIISPDVLSYINVNRNLLPETPFELQISCRVYGVSSAGFTYVTNDIGFTYRIFDERYEVTAPDSGESSESSSEAETVTTDELPDADEASLPEGNEDSSSGSPTLAQPDSNGDTVFGS